MGRGFRKSLARMAARVVWVEDGGLLTLVLDSEITALRQVRHAVSDADIRAFPQACATVVGFWSSADICGALIPCCASPQSSGCEAVDLANRMHQLV